MSQAPLPPGFQPGPQVPAGATPTAGYVSPAPARGGTSTGTKWLIGCLLGGCGVVVLVFVALFVIGGVALLQNFSVSTNASVPSDFPVYPRAVKQAGFSMKARNGAAGQGVTLIQWRAAGRGGPITAWYKDQLNRGDWVVAGSDDALGRITFRRRSSGAQAILQVRDQLAQTVIQLEMTEDQPLAQGAHPTSTDTPNPDFSP
jgi:hypothetical protein